MPYVLCSYQTHPASRPLKNGMVDTGQEAGQHSGPGAHLQDGHQPLGRQAPTVFQTPEQEGVENATGRSGLQGSSPASLLQ